jgi:hypothetical protein
VPGAHEGRDGSAAAKARVVIDGIHDLRQVYFQFANARLAAGFCRAPPSRLSVALQRHTNKC